MLQVCRSLGLYIVNGRLRGDSFGHYTHSSPLGNSTVDYMLTDIDPVHLRAFTVSPLTPQSDHSKITLYLKQNHTQHIGVESSTLHRAVQLYRWTENSQGIYQQEIGNDKIQSLLDNFLTKTYPQSKEGVNLAVWDINFIFDNLATLSKLNKSPKSQNKKDK